MIHSAPDIRAAELAQMARKILPATVSVATGDPRMAGGELHPLEQGYAVKMSRKRRVEFMVGRGVARRAMAPFGYATAPILVAPDRAPVWPENVVGSLSHSTTACIALVASARNFVSLGVDLEEDLPLDAELIPEVCQDVEIRWLSDHPPVRRVRLARLVFSAKETAYKAQYPLTGELFGFDRFSVSFDFAKGLFAARFNGAMRGFTDNQCLNGCFQIGNGLILTAMTLTSSDWKG